MQRMYTVNKNDVLKRITENKNNFDVIYKDAVEGYRVNLRKCAEDMIENIDRGGIPSPYLDEQKPTDYTKKYEYAKQLVSFMQPDTSGNIEITESQMNEWVLDNWDWKRGFITSNAKYSQSISLLDD